MRAVMGIYRPLGGSITWSGHPVGLSDRLRFGYMPEERGLYPQMRVLNQIAYFARLHGLKQRAATSQAQQWLTRLGLEGREQDRVAALSHGNQQRVQLAVALVYQPELLVLDEPFAGLDPSAVDSLSEVLRAETARGTAVLFSSHQLDLVERLCDRVGIIQNGRMVACGSIDELRAGGGEQLVVDAPAAPPNWADGLPGVTVLPPEGRRTVLALDADADDQAVLKAALATGPVREFARRMPSLTELFRDVVRDTTKADDDTTTTTTKRTGRRLLGRGSAA
jgi:ABC-2 type transport system ATP-binding protein